MLSQQMTHHNESHYLKKFGLSLRLKKRKHKIQQFLLQADSEYFMSQIFYLKNIQ